MGRSGHLSNQRAKGGGPRPRSNGSQSGPLRRIVGTTYVGSCRFEALECGHLQLPKEDLMGETNAYRRRCKKCKRNAPVHFAGDPPANMTDEDYQRVSDGKATP